MTYQPVASRYESTSYDHRRTTREIEQGRVPPAHALVIFVGGWVTVLAAVMGR